MQKNRYYILLTVITLGLAILACGLGSDTAPEVSSESQPPVDNTSDEQVQESDASENVNDQDATAGDEESSQEIELPDEGSGPDSLDLDNPDLFNQPVVDYYRESLLYTFTGVSEDGSLVTGTVNGAGAFSQNPLAYTMEFYAEGNALIGDGTVFTFTQIENTSYIYSQEMSCITFSNEDADNPYATMLDTEGDLGGTAQRVMPDEVINGVETYQFKIDATTMDSSDPTTYDMKEIYDGRIYIAKEGGFVVRLWIEGLGQSELLSGSTVLDGDIYYDLNFFDFNIPLEIVPLAECPAEVTSDYPIMDDAFELSTFPGLTSYQTYYSFDEVVAFYKVEMEALGWAVTDEFVSSPAAILTFVRDADIVQVNISENDDAVAIGIVEMNE